MRSAAVSAWFAVKVSAAVLSVTVVLFTAVQVLPGDAAQQALGPHATPETLATLRADLGLDRPVAWRYLAWLTGAVSGDWGTSAVTGQHLTPVLVAAAQRTALLAGVCLAGITVVGAGTALLAGARPGSHTDRTLTAVAVSVTAMPEFVIAAGLTALLAVQLGWLPAISLVVPGASAGQVLAATALPALTLVLYGGAWVARMVRAVVADVATSPAVEAARVTGLPEHLVLLRHVLPQVRAPLVAVLALVVPYLVGGALVVETVFAYPGVGSLLAAGVRQRDAAVVMGAGTVLATASTVAFTLADALGSSPARTAWRWRRARNPAVPR